MEEKYGAFIGYATMQAYVQLQELLAKWSVTPSEEILGDAANFGLNRAMHAFFPDYREVPFAVSPRKDILKALRIQFLGAMADQSGTNWRRETPPQAMPLRPKAELPKRRDETPRRAVESEEDMQRRSGELVSSRRFSVSSGSKVKVPKGLSLESDESSRRRKEAVDSMRAKLYANNPHAPKPHESEIIEPSRRDTAPSGAPPVEPVTHLRQVGATPFPWSASAPRTPSSEANRKPLFDRQAAVTDPTNDSIDEVVFDE